MRFCSCCFFFHVSFFRSMPHLHTKLNTKRANARSHDETEASLSRAVALLGNTFRDIHKKIG